MGTCPGILLPFSFLLFHVPWPVGWSETLRAVYHDRKNTGSGVNQTWHKFLPLQLLATWPWENFLTSDNFLTSPNLSFCFCKMRIKPALRVVVRHKRDEKCWVCNPEWGKPKRQLVWLGGKGRALLVGWQSSQCWVPLHPASNGVIYALGTAGPTLRVHSTSRGPRKWFLMILISLKIIRKNQMFALWKL